jgi:methylated-DNA-[protein]-cysteine S-methyltransferase
MSLPAHIADAVASAAVREGLVDAVYTHVDTPIGRLLLVQGEHGVVRLAFPEQADEQVLAEVAGGIGPRIVASRSELAGTLDLLGRYFEGGGDADTVPVDLTLVPSAFRRAALEALRAGVAPGNVLTYGALAARIGRPRAARAIGTACATNPVPILVPCHRVVPGSGGIGAYGGGPDRKRALLAMEGAILG